MHIHTMYMRAEKTLVKKRRLAGSPEHSLFADVISSKILYAGSFMVSKHLLLSLSDTV